MTIEEKIRLNELRLQAGKPVTAMVPSSSREEYESVTAKISNSNLSQPKKMVTKTDFLALALEDEESNIFAKPSTLKPKRKFMDSESP